MHLSPDLALAALRAGAAGYVTKSSPPDVLLRAIADVLAGRHVLSPDISQALALARLSGRRRPLEDLTAREFDILCMLVSPASVQEIAQRLHLSIKTIHNLHYQIKNKLGVDSDIELTRLALSWGLDLAPAQLSSSAHRALVLQLRFVGWRIEAAAPPGSNVRAESPYVARTALRERPTPIRQCYTARSSR